MVNTTPPPRPAFSLIAFASVFAFMFALTCPSASAAVPTGIAEQLLKQLRQDAPDVRDCESAHGLPFDAQEIQLSAQGGPQYLLTSAHDCLCGQVNCSQWIYRRGPRQWELILETQGYLFKPRATIHQGYRDVETRSRDNAALVDTLVYVFDGQVYRALQSSVPATSNVNVRTHRVQFAPGASSIQLQGSVSAQDSERWTMGARKAQTLRLSLVDHENAGLGITVVGPPGSNGQALSASAIRGEVTLPATGTYTVLVQSRRLALATYTLSVEVR